MSELKIEDYICRELCLDEQKIAMDFITFLKENQLIFYKDNGDYWKDKIYYWVPMNSTGVKQIVEIAEHLQKNNFQVDFIISSPLDRAKESAKIIAEKIGFEGKIIYDEDFSERSFGLAEGSIWNQEINLDDEKYGAESVEDICKRAKVAVDKYMSYDDISVLIVAHGAILSAVKHVLSQGTLGYYDSSVPIIQGNILCCEICQSGSPSFYYLL